MAACLWRRRFLLAIFSLGIMILTTSNIMLHEVRKSEYTIEKENIRTGEHEFVTKIQTYPQQSLSLLQENYFTTDWKEVKGSNRDLFVYSAYYDTRRNESLSVVIIAIIRRKYKIKHCEIYTSHNALMETVAVVSVIREGWNLLYTAAFIRCEYTPSSKDEVPLYVWPKIPGSTETNPPLQVIQMHTRKQHGFMSVCVKPFHYEFNRAVWLVEFIEMYRLMGADHFIFYNHTVGPDVQQVLEHYLDEEVASVYQWNLPVQSQKEIRTEGLFAALNDCNLRSVKRFNYSAFVDIDEFILPRNEGNYWQLFEALGDYSAYVFQNDFFYLYWENDTQVDASLYSNANSLGSQFYGNVSDRPYLLTAYKTTRLSNPHHHGIRSKYIGKPDKILECGNHLVGKYVPERNLMGLLRPRNDNYLNVNANDALTHHYRICEFGGFDCLKDSHEIDRTAHRWLDPLFRNVADNCGQIFPQLGKCPKAPPLGSPW